MALLGTRRDLLPSLANPSCALVRPALQVHQASLFWQTVGSCWHRAEPGVSNTTSASFPGCQTAVSGSSRYEP